MLLARLLLDAFVLLFSFLMCDPYPAFSQHNSNRRLRQQRLLTGYAQREHGTSVPSRAVSCSASSRFGTTSAKASSSAHTSPPRNITETTYPVAVDHQRSEAVELVRRCGVDVDLERVLHLRGRGERERRVRLLLGCFLRLRCCR